MKTLVNGLIIAFSMYSALPMPHREWKDGDMKGMLCFFPLVGVACGGLLYAWYRISLLLGLQPALFAGVAALLPVALTGGVHMDGLVDTADALSSHREREKKLEILSDPHTGAFGVLAVAAVLLLSFGFWTQIYATPGLLLIALTGFTASRAYNALSIVRVPPARDKGLVHTFSATAAKGVVTGVCILFLLAAYGLGIAVSPLGGGVVLVLTLLYFFLHRRMCLREFGGNTGDLAGFLLILTELLFLAVAAIGGGIIG